MAMFVVVRRKRGTQEFTPRPHRMEGWGGSVQNLSLSSRSRAHSVGGSPDVMISASHATPVARGSHSSSSQQGSCVQATRATFAQIPPSHTPIASAVHESMHGRAHWWVQKTKKWSRYHSEERHNRVHRGMSAAMSRCSLGWAWNGDNRQHRVSRAHGGCTNMAQLKQLHTWHASLPCRPRSRSFCLADASWWGGTVRSESVSRYSAY